MFIGTPGSVIEQLQKNLSRDLNSRLLDSQQGNLPRNLDSWHGNFATINMHPSVRYANDAYSGSVYPMTTSEARLVSRFTIACGAEQKPVPSDYIQKWPALRWGVPSMLC